MAKAANNNKSIVLEGVEVFYNEKTDALNIISTDPDLPKGEFFMKVKEGTPTDLTLRKLFAEKTGNRAVLGNSLTADVPQETLTLTDFELKNRYDKYTFPIGVAKDREVVTFDIGDGNTPTNVLITGYPGVGKTIIIEQIQRKAEISKIPIIKWTGQSRLRNKDKIDIKKAEFTSKLEEIFYGEHEIAQPTIVIIDGLGDYLGSNSISFNEAAREWRANVEDFVKLLSLSRSKNVTFILTQQRPELELMNKISPYTSLNIVGELHTVASAIVLGTNDAVKLRNGNFIVKNGTDLKGMKAYHPAMKSDWI